jgi:DNA end-binding protein Ku
MFRARASHAVRAAPLPARADALSCKRRKRTFVGCIALRGQICDEKETRMARPIWNGTISFGLLNVPVRLFSGERTVDVHFRMLDSRDNKPVRYERVNSETGEEVPWKEIVKGFEYSKGSYVVVDEEDIRKAAPQSTETVEIEAFVDRDEIDPRYFEKPYYLVPAKKAEKGYVLLREVLKKTNKVGIARVVIRTRQYLATLMSLDDALVLDLMRFPQELVEEDEFELPAGSLKDYRVTPKEMEMAGQLIESMTTKWRPSDYKDDFRTKLRRIIDAEVARQTGKKGKAKAVEEEAPAEATTNVVDFMALLKRSLEKKGSGGAARKAPRKATAKRSRTARRKVS